MSEWYGCDNPACSGVPVQPTAEIVQSAHLHLVPGARLTADLMGVTDSQGYVTRFYLVGGQLLFAKVWCPDGTDHWMRYRAAVRDA